MTPFEQAFGDENVIYDRYAERYRAKNARFDSLDELYLVAGVSDAFMSAFGDKLTVFPDMSARINVNTTDVLQVMVNILVMADTRTNQPALNDPGLVPRVIVAVEKMRLMSFFSITVAQFATVLQSEGITLRPEYAKPNSDQRGVFGDRSSTFRIKAVGSVGSVQKTLDAVVTTDQVRAGKLARDLGRVLYWSER
jgi:general secretion pathway protein K